MTDEQTKIDIPNEPVAEKTEPEFDWSMTEAEENTAEETPLEEEKPEQPPEPEKAEEPEKPAEPAKPVEELKAEPPKAEEPKAEEPKPPETPKFSEAELAGKRTAFIEELAASYQLTPEQEEAYIEDPVKALPKLAAQWTTRVFEDTYRTIAAQLPQLLEQHLAARETAQSYSAKAEEAFWSRWPGLKGNEETVRQIAERFSRANPDASMEEAIDFVGTYASTKLGLQPPQAQPAAPAAPVRKSAPPPPAAAGRTVGDAPQKETNIFAELSALED